MVGSSSPLTRKLLLLFLIFSGLYFGKDFFMPLFIGTILATIFLPFCKWLEGKKIPKLVAPLFCLLILLILIAGVVILIQWQISELTNDAAIIRAKATKIFDELQQYVYDNANISKVEQTRIIRGEQSSVAKVIPTILGSLAYLFTNFILVLVYIYLLLYYRIHIRDFIFQLSPADKKNEVREVVYKAAKVSQQYLLGLAKMIVFLWIMYAIGFTIAGVENPWFFAILCGMLEIVPFIGNITGTTLTVLVSAVKGGDSSMLAGIVITYGIVQFIQGWVLETIIVGPQVKINPLFTILALVLGELIWGIPGVILAIPLIAMLKIVFDNVDTLKPYGFLLGETETTQKKWPLAVKIKKWFKAKKSSGH
ncbi:MAG: AI-2E family transporter [Bacteroidetes bacterium]|nr:AI-2E family transporter [Bacteroidota bacterium]